MILPTDLRSKQIIGFAPVCVCGGTISGAVRGAGAEDEKGTI